MDQEKTEIPTDVPPPLGTIRYEDKQLSIGDPDELLSSPANAALDAPFPFCEGGEQKYNDVRQKLDALNMSPMTVLLTRCSFIGGIRLARHIENYFAALLHSGADVQPAQMADAFSVAYQRVVEHDARMHAMADTVTMFAGLLVNCWRYGEIFRESTAMLGNDAETDEAGASGCHNPNCLIHGPNGVMSAKDPEEKVQRLLELLQSRGNTDVEFAMGTVEDLPPFIRERIGKEGVELIRKAMSGEIPADDPRLLNLNGISLIRMSSGQKGQG